MERNPNNNYFDTEHLANSQFDSADYSSVENMSQDVNRGVPKDAPQDMHQSPSSQDSFDNYGADFNSVAPYENGQYDNNPYDNNVPPYDERQYEANQSFNDNAMPFNHNTTPFANNVASPNNPQHPNNQYAHQPYAQSHYAHNNVNTHNTQNPNNNTYHDSYTQRIQMPHSKQTSSKKSKVLSMQNEKFVILALLSSVIITVIIVGVGWALISPKKALPNINEIALAQKETADVLSNLSETPAGDAQDLLIIYNNNSFPETTATANAKANAKATSDNVAKATSDNVAKATSDNVAKATSDKVAKATSDNTASSNLRSNTDNIINTSPNSISKSTPQKTNPARTPLSASNITQAKKIKNPATTTQTFVAQTRSTQYWIQVFSTINRDKAEQIKNDLISQGITPTIVTKNNENTLYYRLRVGPYDNKSEANKFLSWFSGNNSYKGAYISMVYPKS